MQQQLLSHPNSIYPAASPIPLEGEGVPAATPKRKLAALAAGEGGDDGVREQDRFLPIANISRILRRAVPLPTKVSKEAKEAVQESVSEFISFITSEASDKCQQEKRKTINGDDLLWAMSTLGFEKYVDPLRIYLSKYREATARSSAAVSTKGKAARNAAAAAAAAGAEEEDEDEGDVDG
jgi:nuclear transcription Y subunit beta